MNMEEILSQWNEIQRKEKSKAPQIQKSGKKANAPSAIKAEQNKLLMSKDKECISRQTMEDWLDLYEIQDKDRKAQERTQQQKEKSKSYLVKMKPDATLDLHGLTQEEAEKRLKSFVTQCKQMGLKKILIIHGKGIHSKDGQGVLTRVVRNFIENDKRCGMSGHPGVEEGASGATWVILK